MNKFEKKIYINKQKSHIDKERLRKCQTPENITDIEKSYIKKNHSRNIYRRKITIDRKYIRRS